MTSLENEVRILVANHGTEAVYTALHETMRKEYAFLSRIFKGEPVTAPVVTAAAVTAAVTVAEPLVNDWRAVPIPSSPCKTPTMTASPVTVITTAATAPATTTSSSKKVRRVNVRKATETVVEATPAPVTATPVPAPATGTPVTSASDLGLELISSPLNSMEVEPAVEGETKKFRSPAEMKAFQKAAEKAKRAELDKKGITVDSLLTRANLQKWIVDDGKTYAWVAREMVGCPEMQVSITAKSYGIQSTISKKKAVLMANAAANAAATASATASAPKP